MIFLVAILWQKKILGFAQLITKYNCMKRFVIFFFIFSSCLSLLAQNDVDTYIAVNDQIDNNTFVLIISNEHYKYEQAVPYALNDGEIFHLYCEKTLGIPKRNIRYVADATLNDMRIQIQWLIKVMNAFDGDGRAILYYSGHGLPSEDGKQTFLLPIDGNSTLSGSGLSTGELYKQLSEMPSRQTLVLLDACFSGARRDGKMLSASRGVAIKAKQEPVDGKLVVFSASQGNETAYPFTEKQHGLFSYYLLECLQKKGGNVKLGELSDYVIKQVKRMSILENDKEQTPSIISSASNKEWRTWPFATKTANNYVQITKKNIDSSEKSEPESSNVNNRKTYSNDIVNLSTEEKIINNTMNEDMEYLVNNYGISIRPVIEEQKKQLKIKYGIEVLKVENGPMKDGGIPKGFIILKINNKQIYTIADFYYAVQIEEGKQNPSFLIRGIFPTGKKGYFVICPK